MYTACLLKAKGPMVQACCKRDRAGWVGQESECGCFAGGGRTRNSHYIRMQRTLHNVHLVDIAKSICSKCCVVNVRIYYLCNDAFCVKAIYAGRMWLSTMQLTNNSEQYYGSPVPFLYQHKPTKQSAVDWLTDTSSVMKQVDVGFPSGAIRMHVMLLPVAERYGVARQLRMSPAETDVRSLDAIPLMWHVVSLT
ncbi:unnamed protein product [Toxocara canis]|uniref:SCP domain-containing protein n=1 Tax=Toxocara canis TaxID=6265 RepID=A0A183UUC5_TOXCA|nr:unnamed protein product [Toxocara canis]